MDGLTLGVTRELPLWKDEKTKYLADLGRLADKGENRQKFKFEHFYMNLDVLDGKTNSMIQFTSVIATIHTAIFGYIREVKTISLKELVYPLHGYPEINYALEFPVIAGAVLAFASSGFFLGVIKVHWSSPEELANKANHARRLLDVRNRRTIRYRIGWLLSAASTGLLLLTIVTIAYFIPEPTQPGICNCFTY